MDHPPWPGEWIPKLHAEGGWDPRPSFQDDFWPTWLRYKALRRPWSERRSGNVEVGDPAEVLETIGAHATGVDLSPMMMGAFPEDYGTWTYRSTAAERHVHTDINQEYPNFSQCLEMAGLRKTRTDPWTAHPVQ